jgi:hypothetical protein
MATYEIKRWDVVLFGNSVAKTPMFYIIPDTYLLEFARTNNFTLFCQIIDTDTIYDNIMIPCVIDESSFLPDYRPNFFSQTGSYVVTLKTNWNGYPKKLGKVKFFGYKQPVKQSMF